MKVLGISGSLRSVRFGASNNLCDEIRTLSSEKDLFAYLDAQVKVDVHTFFENGPDDGCSFIDLSKELQKKTKERGMSNSEGALAVALWGAYQGGCEMDYLCLAAHMTPSCEIRDPEKLKSKILGADAIILSGPVYFGDRGSLAQSLFELIRTDPDLVAHVKGKPFAGISSGAKRNGGQETSLIYQIVDATNLDMLVLGNGSETTAQYGGTIVAGDVGTLTKDTYGLNTAISTGKRVAEVVKMIHDTPKCEIKRTQIGVWLLQDNLDQTGLKNIRELCDRVAKDIPDINFVIRDITKEFVYRCIACDLCPSCVGPIDAYRCTVKTKDDFFVKNHADLIEDDAILLAAYSPENAQSIVSKYQQFIERTRYLRRDNYLLANRLATAFVMSEINANKNLHIRMLTSVIRHNTILHKPIIGYEHQKVMLNTDAMSETLHSFARRAKMMTAARLSNFTYTAYNPVGYVISSEATKNDARTGALEQDRVHRLATHKEKLKKRGERP